MSSSAALTPAKALSIVKQSIDSGEGLRTSTQAIALLCHANALAAHFKCVDPISGADAPFSVDDPQALKLSDDDIHLRYTGATDLHLKISQMGKRTTIYAMDTDDQSASFDVATDEYTGGSFPRSSEASEPLSSAFVSLAQVKAFNALFEARILQELLNSSEQDDAPSQSSKPRQQQAQAQSHTGEDEQRIPMPTSDEPLRLPTQESAQRRPSDWPPELEDEHQLLQSNRGGLQSGGRGIGNIGEDDLRPPGIDAMHPFSRGGPGLPPGGGGGHRGMYPTPDDFYPDANKGPFGELPDGRRPGPAPPAGARYDPVFPGDPFGGPGRGSGRGPGMQPPFGGGSRGGGRHDIL